MKTGMKRRFILWAVFMFFMVSHASAENFRSITAVDLKGMLDKKTKIFLVDARAAEEYRQGHIPKAVNIPPEKVGNIGALLPKDKKALIVIYCRGVG